MGWFIASAVVAATGFFLLCFYALATVSARADADAEEAFRAMRQSINRETGANLASAPPSHDSVDDLT